MKTKLLESDYANKTFADKNVLGLQQYAPLSTNALQIDIATGKLNGKIEAIRTSDASLIQNYFIMLMLILTWFILFLPLNGEISITVDGVVGNY